RARRHLAALVADAHHPVAPAGTRQLPLRGEGQPVRLRGSEVLRHPAHHGVDVLGTDATEVDQADALGRPRRGAIDRRSPLAGRDAVTLARAWRVDDELRVLHGARMRERLERLVEVAAPHLAVVVERVLDLGRTGGDAVEAAVLDPERERLPERGDLVVGPALAEFLPRALRQVA